MPNPRFGLLIFPGLWVVLLVTLAAINVFYLYAAPAAWLGGILLYGLALLLGSPRCRECGNRVWGALPSRDGVKCFACLRRPRRAFVFFSRVSLHVLVLFLILAGPFIPIPVNGRPPFDSIGDASDNGLGGPPCDKEELASVSVRNRVGQVAALRKTFCSWGFAEGSRLYFVSLHGSTGNNTSENLIFRYEPTTEGWLGDGPRLIWRGDKTLIIRLKRPDVERVTKKRVYMDGVTIVYAS